MGTRKRRKAASAGARLAAGSLRKRVSRQGNGQKSHPSGSFVTDKHLSAPIDFTCSQKSGCFWPGGRERSWRLKPFCVPYTHAGKEQSALPAMIAVINVRLKCDFQIVHVRSSRFQRFVQLKNEVSERRRAWLILGRRSVIHVAHLGILFLSFMHEQENCSRMLTWANLN